MWSSPLRTEAFFRVVDAVYERRSVAVSSNLHPGFDTIMPKTLAPPTVARLLHHGHLVPPRAGPTAWARRWPARACSHCPTRSHLEAVTLIRRIAAALFAFVPLTGLLGTAVMAVALTPEPKWRSVGGRQRRAPGSLPRTAQDRVTAISSRRLDETPLLLGGAASSTRAKCSRQAWRSSTSAITGVTKRRQ